MVSIKTVIKCLVGVLIIYLIFTTAEASFNPFKWMVESRIATGLYSGCVIMIVVILDATGKITKNKK